MENKYIIKFYLIALITVICTPLISQNWDCGTSFDSIQPMSNINPSCTYSSNAYIDYYSNKEYWQPHYTLPLKYVHVNFHIWQRSDGTGNVQNDQDGLSRLNQIFTHIQNRYLNLTTNPDPPVSYNINLLSDSRVRFILDSIYFYQDHTSDSSFYYPTGSYINEYNYYLEQNFPERTNALNIHFSNGYLYDLGDNVAGYSDMFDSWNIHTYDYGQQGIWFMGSVHLPHELGHSFGLYHTYDYNPQNCKTSQEDFLYDVYDTTVTECLYYCDTTSCPDSTYDCNTCFFEGGESNNLMGGGSSSHISSLQAGIMHRSMSLYGNLRDHITGYHYVPLQITENETWDFSIKIYQDIIVKSGNTLTIDCEVEMVPNAKIVVEPGARLIVDGGIITNEKYYNKPWAGIEVWGNSTAHQYLDANGDYQQAYLEIKNNAVIENADFAVRLWHSGDWDEMGGIVRATNSTFRNNRKAVEFMTYENFEPTTGEHRPNQSMLSNCTFETDDNYVNPYYFQSHVTLYKVDGVRFYGCDFIDSRASFQSPPYFRAMGISSLDANYLVLPRCIDIQTNSWVCAGSNLDSTNFIGLNIAVNAAQSRSSYSYVIDRTNFVDNLHGIYNSSTDYSSCIRSDFKVGTKQNAGPYYIPLGIINDMSSTFTFNQNKFESQSSLPSGLDFTAGIWNLSLGDDLNTIRDNEYTGLGYANIASGDNHHNTDPFNGLLYKCNNNTTNTKYDFYVYAGEGIATYQGAASMAAGNTFSQNTTPEGSDFNNEAIWPVNYYFDPDIPLEIPVNYNERVFTKEAPPSNCSARFDENSHIRLSTSEKNSYRQQFEENKEEYDNIKVVYDNLVDGGSTSSLLLDIETSWPDETWILRAQLLAESPHLSEQVLMAAADNTAVLPHAIMFEICMANPEEMRNERFLEFLALKQDPMPQYMIDDLIEGADTESYKSVLQNEMVEYATLWNEAYRNLVRDVVLDSTGIAYDTLRYYLAEKATIHGEYEIVDSYLAEDDYTSTMSHLNNIPNNYTLSSNQLVEYNYFYDLKNTIITAANQGRNLFQLDSLEVSDLVYIADSSVGVAGMQARNILNFVYGFTYFDLPDLPEPNMKRGIASESSNQNKVSTSTEHFITAYPNPANNWVAFEYTLPYPAETGMITITDLSGRQVVEIRVDGPLGQKVWDTKDLSPGVYIYNLVVYGQTIDVRKLVINK